MDIIDELAEQHLRESAARLRHIDELMARARAASLKPESASRAEKLLRQIEPDRNKLARELEDLRSLPRGNPSEVVARGEGLKGLLGSVGLQLEQTLATIFEQEK